VAEHPSTRSPQERERTSPVTFYRQVVAELRKVVWPSQQQLVTYFLVVLVFVLVLIGFVAVLDLAFGKAVFAIFGGETSGPGS
jgi:preprotein translocase subunit SecE